MREPNLSLEAIAICNIAETTAKQLKIMDKTNGTVTTTTGVEVNSAVSSSSKINKKYGETGTIKKQPYKRSEVNKKSKDKKR